MTMPFGVAGSDFGHSSRVIQLLSLHKYWPDQRDEMLAACLEVRPDKVTSKQGGEGVSCESNYQSRTIHPKRLRIACAESSHTTFVLYGVHQQGWPEHANACRSCSSAVFHVGHPLTMIARRTQLLHQQCYPIKSFARPCLDQARVRPSPPCHDKPDAPAACLGCSWAATTTRRRSCVIRLDSL